MKTAERLSDSKAVRILFAILLVVGLAPTLALPQQAYAATTGCHGDGRIKVTYGTGEVVEGTWQEGFLTIDGALAFCADPNTRFQEGVYVEGSDPVATGRFTQECVTDLALAYEFVQSGQFRTSQSMNDGHYATSADEKYAISQCVLWEVLVRHGYYDYGWFGVMLDGKDLTGADDGHGDMWNYIAQNRDDYIGHATYYDCSSSQDVMNGFSLTPAYGWMELDKDSTNTDITDGNDAYDLAGAVYGIYADRDDANARRDAVQTMTTNGDGWARSGDLAPGTYYVRESNKQGEHGSGFAVDEQIYEVAVESGETAYVNGGKVYDKPQNDPAYLLLGKYDGERTYNGDANLPQGSASLAGAQFEVRYFDGYYSSASAAEASGNPTRTWVFKTDADGFINIEDEYYLVSGDLYRTEAGNPTLPLGTYCIQEIKAPEGYVLPDPAPVYVQRVTQQGITGDVVNEYNAPEVPESVARGGVVIEKVDAETGGESVNGSDLSGAVFRIVNESENAVEINGKWVDAGEKAIDITTDENGVAQTDADLLPYGDYSVTEITAPDGYFGTDKTIEFSITLDGEVKRFEGTSGFSNQSIRGDLEFQKKDESDGTALAHIPFRLTNDATGESHIIVTDANGYASTSAEWNKHTLDTNANDDAVEGEWSDTAGIWFGEDAGAAPDDDLGALPIGTYTLEELPCEANEGLQLVVQEGISITRDGVAVDLGTIDDPDKGAVYIGTSASDAADGDKTVSMGANAKVVDRVFYMGLEVGETYTLSSSMLVTDSGDALDFGEGPITSSVEFTAEAANGTVDVVIDLGSTAGALVDGATEIRGTVYEELYDSQGRLVAEHKELKDSGQIVRIVPPEASTKASDGADGDRIVAADPDSVIHDEVSYTHLEAGADYRLLSAAVPREFAADATPDNLDDAIGTADITFEASDLGWGSVGSDVYCDTSDLEDGQAIVMMAWIFDAAGNLVASHADPNAQSQTVTVKTPSISTTASDPVDGDQVVIDDGSRQVTITDIVSFENLVPNRTYRLEGTIMDAQTGLALKNSDGSSVYATAEFTPALSAGTVEVTFTFDASAIPTGGSLVVFEDLYRGDEKIATHADIDDAGQTITIERPSMWTDASDPADGDQTVVIDPEVYIHDQVSVQNVVDTRDYRLIGIVMDKATGLPFVQDEVDGLEAWWSDVKAALGADEDGWKDGMPRDVDLDALDALMDTEVGHAVAASSTDFRLPDSWGQVGTDFGPIDLTALEAGHQLVVFQALINVEGSCMIAEHADLSDEGQTIGTATPKLDSVAVDASDGDKALAEDPENVVTETLSVTDAVPSVEYRVVAQANMLDDGELVPLGDPVEKTFTLPDTWGEVEISIPVDASALAGGKVVITDVLYRGDAKIAEHIDADDPDQTLDVYEPELGTTAADDLDGDKNVVTDPMSSIRDSVDYNGLIPFKSYTLTGTLHEKSTGEPLLDAEGNPVTSTVEFTPQTPAGTVDMTFTFDSSLLDGESIVAFETLYRRGIEIASHADIDDEGQTVEVTNPELDSVAIDSVDGDKLVVEDPEAGVVETLTVTNAVPGVEYRVVAELSSVDEGGNATDLMVPVEKTFTLDHDHGDVTIELPVDASTLAGKKIVVTDTLYRGDAALAVHDSVLDQDQSVEVFEPEIATSATDGLDGDKNVVTETMATVTDLVSYEDLVVGKSYTLVGTLHVKSTGEPLLDAEGNPVTSTVEFTPQTPAGTVEMTFEFDSRLLDGESLVAFETLYRGGIEITSHADLTDEGQTVEVTNPELDSVAVDVADGDKDLAEDPEACIVETLSVTNAVPGVEYRVVASATYIASDGTQGAAGADVEKTFTLDHDHGEVTIEIPVDSSTLAGGRIVITDMLYRGDVKIAEHADLLDADQSVDVYEPEIATTAADGLDGDKNVVTDTVSTIRDTVHLEGIVVGKSYDLVGFLMIASTGEPLLDAEGDPVTSHASFVAEHESQDVEMTFTFDSRLLDGEDVVVFEDLYREGVLIASHADLTDEGQTVEVTNPELDSVAVDVADGDKDLAEDPEAAVSETLYVSNAVPGSEYTARAQLYVVGEDGAAELLGEAVEKSFTLDHDHGEVAIEVPCDVSTLAGKSVVMTDELFRDGVKIAEHTDLADPDQTLDVYEPELGTTASDPVDGDQTVVIDPETTITDVVEYTGLVVGKSYTVTLVPHVKSTGEALIDPETGEPYSATVEFTPEKADGSVEVSITVDTTALSGDALVAFETLYRDGIEIAAHVDLNDEGQTVEVVQPLVDTVAVDGLDGDKTVVADAEAKVKDTLSYEDLLPEASYTSHGILMDAETGLPLLSGEGAEDISAEELSAFWNEFKALLNIQQAAIEPEGPLDGGEGIEGEPPSDAAREDAVFDDVVEGSAVAGIVSLFEQVAPEADDDAEAAQETESAEMPLAASMADWEGIDDLLEANPEIAACISTAEVEFIADRSFGEIEADFGVDAADLAGKQAVVFQLLTKEDSEGRAWTVALHDDIDDADQTVDIVASEIGTEAVDKTDGDHVLLNSKDAVVVDRVSYENLIPSKEYRISGVLYDKATGEPLIVGDKQVTAEKLFTPNEPSGTVELEFAFDASALAGHELVVFEHLYKDGVEVAAHADIDDAAQTVTVEQPPIGDTYGKTGRDIAVIGGAILAVIAVGTGIAAYAIRRRRAAKAALDENAA